MKKAACLSLVLALSATTLAVAAPAPWFKWRSLLTGEDLCAQVMHGQWEKVAGPFKDAQCRRHGVPG
jgi:hypothetical protein